MYKVGDLFEVKIEKIAFGGEGIAYIDDMVVFVPMSAIGDKLLVRIISTKKTYLRALIEKIIKPSLDRVADDKFTFKDFNGCDFAMLKYEKQLEYKDIMLKELFLKMLKMDISDKYENIIGANGVFNYRNKVAEPFFIENGLINTGFYERKSHEIFSTEKDYLKSKIAIKITKKVLEKLNEAKFTVFNDKSNKGFLKHLIIRNNSKDEVMLAIVTNKKKGIDKLTKVLKEIYEQNSEVKSVYISVKNRLDNVIIGDENIHIIGDEYISENIFDISFKIYLDSFFQINIEQVKKLYSKALSYIGKEGSMAIDAFSGTGTIAMLLSKKFSKVYAIEYTKSSVLSAKKAAMANNISNIKFICSKVEDKIENIVKHEKIDYIVFDPPRKGIDKNVLLKVAENGIENIVYISCEPSTMVRDIEILQEHSYTLRKISAVDMFPNTHHVECIALIQRVKS